MVNKICNAWICKIENNRIIPVFGDLLFNNGKISAIKKKSFKEYLQKDSLKEKNSFDAEGKVLTIPNINFHEHIYSRLAKGLPVKGKTDNFYRILDNIWWKLDRSLDHEMTKVSAELASLESIKNGVSYIFDHHASPLNAKGSLNQIAHVLRNHNLRGVLTHETSDRNGKKYSEESIEENKEFFLKYNDTEIKSLFGLHASFTVSEDTLNETYKFVKDYNLGIHIHICEDETDRKLSVKKYGDDPLSRLINHKLLNQQSILAHAIHLNRKEYNKIARYGSAVAINIDSNLNNSVGTHNFNTFPDKLIIVCGTDGMHANPAKTIKNIFLLMRHSGLSANEAFNRVEKIYTDQINFVQRFFPDFGKLNKNDRADFIIWDYTPPTPINKDNFWGHYIFGITESTVNSTVQAGNFLMHNKKVTNIKEDQIYKSIYKQGERLFRKIKKL